MPKRYLRQDVEIEGDGLGLEHRVFIGLQISRDNKDR